MFFWKAASFEENLIAIYLKCLSFSQNGDMEFISSKFWLLIGQNQKV